MLVLIWFGRIMGCDSVRYVAFRYLSYSYIFYFMSIFRFLSPVASSFQIIFILFNLLESIAIFFLFLCFYLYLHFFPLFSDFFYFSLFFLHVPISWLSLLNYCLLVIVSAYYFFFKDLEVFLYSKVFIVLGILFTSLTIFTGMLWGLPLWGLLFVFDARFITVLALLVLYLLFLFLFYLGSYNKVSYQLIAFFIMVGSLNIPLIKYSVDWWNTLHQSATFTQVYGTVHFSVYIPLFLFFFMFLVFYLYSCVIFFYLLFLNSRVFFFRFRV